MKRTSRELKALARNALKGHYATLIGATVLLGIFTSILGLLPQTLIRNSNNPFSLILQFIVTLIAGVLGYLLQLGITAMILRMIRGQYFGVGDLLYAFQHHPDRFIILGIIEILISTVLQFPADICLYNAGVNNIGLAMLGSLLMLAASIISLIILLGFALCEMLMIDNEDLGAIDSIRQSFALMSGNKGRLFYIQLSFFGLALLAILSCGIGMLWLTPYMLTTEVFFYMDVCGELDQPHYDDPYTGSGNYGGNEWNTYHTNGYNNGSANNYGNGYNDGSANNYGNGYDNGSGNNCGNGYNNSNNSYGNDYNTGSDSGSYNYGQSNDHDSYNTEA